MNRDFIFELERKKKNAMHICEYKPDKISYYKSDNYTNKCDNPGHNKNIIKLNKRIKRRYLIFFTREVTETKDITIGCETCIDNIKSALIDKKYENMGVIRDIFAMNNYGKAEIHIVFDDADYCEDLKYSTRRFTIMVNKDGNIYKVENG